jgi:hypothetical protein
MDPLNKGLEELRRFFRATGSAFWQRRPDLKIPRVFSNANDDADLDDAPDALVGARLIPRRPIGGSAIALPEPDEDALVGAIASRCSVPGATHRLARRTVWGQVLYFNIPA